MAVFIPIRFPELSRSGPPLLPGLIAASVWITSWIGRPVAAELISLLSPLIRMKIDTNKHQIPSKSIHVFSLTKLRGLYINVGAYCIS